MRDLALSKALCESDLQEYGAGLLELDGWRRIRTNPCSDRSRGKGFGEIGMADDLFVRYGPTGARVTRVWVGQQKVNDDPWQDYPVVQAEVWWIEWKRPKGKPTQAQLLWHEAERKRGAFTSIAGVDFEATPEGFAAFYRASGLMRRYIR